MYQYNSLLSQPMVMPAPPNSPYSPPPTTQQFSGGMLGGGYGGGYGGGSFAQYLSPRGGGLSQQRNPHAGLRQEVYDMHPTLQYRADAYRADGSFDQDAFEYNAMQGLRRRGMYPRPAIGPGMINPGFRDYRDRNPLMAPKYTPMIYQSRGPVRSSMSYYG